MNLLTVALIIAVLDLPWLGLNMSRFQTIFGTIQGGRPLEFRLLGAIPVYIALAYLVSKAESLTEAFLIGAATYAVYDFTTLLTFKDYPLGMAVADTIWGGVLMAATFWVLRKIDL
jgi:hypothetical protein